MVRIRLAIFLLRRDVMLTVNFILYVIAFALTLVSGISGKVPLWVPVLLICIVGLITNVGRG